MYIMLVDLQYVVSLIGAWFLDSKLSSSYCDELIKFLYLIIYHTLKLSLMILLGTDISLFHQMLPGLQKPFTQ